RAECQANHPANAGHRIVENGARQFLAPARQSNTMLEIRSEQITVFEQAALEAFEDEMVEHLKKFSPEHCEVMGEPRVRSVIQLGMARAKTYGFTNRGPVRFYLEM